MRADYRSKLPESTKNGFEYILRSNFMPNALLCSDIADKLGGIFEKIGLDPDIQYKVDLIEESKQDMSTLGIDHTGYLSYIVVDKVPYMLVISMDM